MTNLAGILRTTGRSIIEHGSGRGPSIPLQQDGVVFRQMFEYSVADFEAEVGFYAAVFGFSVVAMTEDYALFADPHDGFCLSFRKCDTSHNAGLKLLFMTRDIDAADNHLGSTGLVDDREIRTGSDVQRVIHFAAPSGLAIEIWEMPASI